MAVPEHVTYRDGAFYVEPKSKSKAYLTDVQDALGGALLPILFYGHDAIEDIRAEWTSPTIEDVLRRALRSEIMDFDDGFLIDNVPVGQLRSELADALSEAVRIQSRIIAASSVIVE